MVNVARVPREYDTEFVQRCAYFFFILSSVPIELLAEILDRHSGVGRNPGFLDPGLRWGDVLESATVFTKWRA